MLYYRQIVIRNTFLLLLRLSTREDQIRWYLIRAGAELLYLYYFSLGAL